MMITNPNVRHKVLFDLKVIVKFILGLYVRVQLTFMSSSLWGRDPGLFPSEGAELRPPWLE